MSSWSNEVETGMDAGVMVGVDGPLHLEFLLEVLLKLVIDIVHYWLKAVKQIDTYISYSLKIIDHSIRLLQLIL